MKLKMAPSPDLHPYVTRSAKDILDPPKKFGIRDFKKIVWKTIKWVGIAIAICLTLAGIYLAVVTAMLV